MFHIFKKSLSLSWNKFFFSESKCNDFITLNIQVWSTEVAFRLKIIVD